MNIHLHAASTFVKLNVCTKREPKKVPQPIGNGADKKTSCFCMHTNTGVHVFTKYTGLFISPSGISELDCATTKTDTAERSISIGRESLNVFFVLGALAYLQVPPLGASRDEKWREQ